MTGRRESRNCLEVCRRVRGNPRLEPTYLILLTARNAKGDAVAGPLLVSKGHEVSEPLLQRLRNFSLNGTVREPIKVYRS
jgi:CheY-like chemotaxis protein